VKREIDSPIDLGPRFIYEPYYVVPKSYDELQNTDPFVFGDEFHYTLCRQSRARLRHLSPGSVILFGSCKNHAFVLDTVFVVDRWIDHTRSNYRSVLAGKISQVYQEVTISPMYQEPCATSKSCAPAGSLETWRLYFGASYDKPLRDMYSFFPCQLYDAKSTGFVRPRVSLPGVITDKLNMGVKLTYLECLDDMKLIWGKVVKQVEEQGSAFGVYAEMPERRLTDKRSLEGAERTPTGAAQSPKCCSS
jgi:hypothetical protein